jgi:hypothetical protein
MTVLTRPRPRCSTADEITVDRLDVARAMDRLAEIVAAYVEVYAPTGDPFFGEERFRLQLAGHMGSPAWELDCAEVDGELVGFVCGFALPATTSWWRGLETKVPRGFTGEDGHRTLAISHVVVRAPWRRRHVARPASTTACCRAARSNGRPCSSSRATGQPRPRTPPGDGTRPPSSGPCGRARRSTTCSSSIVSGPRPCGRWSTSTSDSAQL